MGDSSNQAPDFDSNDDSEKVAAALEAEGLLTLAHVSRLSGRAIEQITYRWNRSE